LHSRFLSNNTIAIPAIVRITPIQELIDGCSCRNKTANSTVRTGIKVVISIAMLGLSLYIAIKKNVSPNDIPSTPLIIKKNNVLFSIGSKPIIDNNMPIHNTATRLLPIFIPIGETLCPIFLYKIATSAHKKEESNANKYPRS
jgi:hypothetical protein